MEELEVLDISRNLLSGGLPVAWSGMAMLQELYAANNLLTGETAHLQSACPVTALYHAPHTTASEEQATAQTVCLHIVDDCQAAL
jgi:hypothetical protein